MQPKATKGLLPSRPLPPTTFTKVDMSKFLTPSEKTRIAAAKKMGK